MKKNNIISVMVSLLVLFSVSAQAQWTVSAGDAAKKAPFEINKEYVSSGKAIYTKNCVSCHGAPTEGKNIAAINAPDLGVQAYQNGKKLGEIYTKITEGKGGMPAFAGSLSDDDRWEIAMFLKTFDANSSCADFAIKCITADLQVTLDEAGKKLVAKVADKSEHSMGTLAGVKVQFMAKRTFGNLVFAEVQTDSTGTATATFPTDLPGDSTGNAEVIVAFADIEAFGAAKFEKKVKWAKATIPVNPLDGRHLWGTSASAPLWIMLSYIIGVLGAWSVIIYVVFQILKLKKAGLKKA